MERDSRACPSCDHEVDTRYARCGHCGAAIDERAAAREIRRLVTIVTSDLKGSTALGERLDPESLREVMTTYVDEMKAVFESHGGTIEKIIGDAIVAVFGLPTARDDDALRAVEGAAESQRALTSLNDRLDERWGVRLTVRTGVATGDVVVGEAGVGQHVLTGPTMAIATAMEQNAPANEVLLAESTHDVVRDATEVEAKGPVTPKGRDEEIQTYRLVTVAERSAPVEAGATESARICQTCGEENPDDFRYCGTCGDTLAPRQVVRDTRKTVTIVFADPKPTTADGTPPTPEALRDVMSEYFAGMQRALDRHGATVEKFIGDAVMAVFGLPVRHEDDALRAVRAAQDMQAVLPELNERFSAEYGITLANHIGVNTGEVVAGDASLGQRLVTGDTVNVAARLEQSAGDREILLGDLTYRLVRAAATVEEVEPLTLKGKSEPVPAYRLVKVAAAGEGIERRSDAPMIGRETEMTALRDLFGRALTERACRMATVVGDAGVGKSRLVAEFTAERAQEALVIRGRCLPYGDGITFWPLREAVREAASIGADDGVEAALAKLRARVADEAVSDRLASVIGLSDQPFPVPEVFWGARRFLEGLAQDRPVLMVVDDIHWAEATFLDLIGNLLESVESAPVLLLCTSRRELLEKHEDWAEGDGSLRLVLSPLTDADAGLVIAALLGGMEIDDAVRGRIVQAAAGNPLFVEQLLSMLIDEGTLRREEDRWVQVGDLARLDVPPSIEALLAARLDLLEADERGVIEPAAVIGQNFATAAVTDLVAPPIAPAVPEHLQGLTRKQLVAPNPDADEAEAGYRFHHLLVRDAAYNGLLKRTRAELHERFVAWAEAFNASHGVDDREFEEIHGYHLEQAYRYLTELGTVDDHALELGIHASEKLASAGHRAMTRGDVPAAASLLRRATATRGEDDPGRLELLPTLAEALTELGEFDQATDTVTEALTTADRLASESVAARVRLVRLLIQMYSGEAGQHDDWASTAAAEVDAARGVFESAADPAGSTLAWRLTAALHGTAQRMGAMAQASERTVDSARRSGNFRAEMRGAVVLAGGLLYGPTSVTQAIARLEALADETSPDQVNHAKVNLYLAQLYAMHRRFDEARELYRGAKEKLVDLKAGIGATTTSLDAGRVELLAGDLVAAETVLRQDYEALTAMGERYSRASVAGLLARALEAQKRFDEASEICKIAEEISAPDDVDAQSIWRGVRARLLARGGDDAGAAAMAARAIALREAGDTPILHAEALADLAATHVAAGRAADAARTLQEAQRLAESKGDSATLERLSSLLATTGAR